MDRIDGIGEIVTWAAPKKTPYAMLQTAVKNAGLSEDLLSDMRPSNAFRRAVKHLEDNRIIRQTLDDGGYLHFQFTGEHLVGGEFQYAKECTLKLNKSTGIVSCTDANVEVMAQKLIYDHMAERNASDVTRVVQRIFKSNGDLFPFRDSGGVYYVPEHCKSICDQVEQMMEEIGGKVRRVELGSTPRNTQSAAVSIRDGIMNLISDQEKYMEDLEGDNTRKMSTASREIKTIQGKLDAYRDVLSSYCGDIERALDKSRAKLNAIATGTVVKDSGEETEEPEEPEDTVQDEPEEEEPEDDESALLSELFGDLSF